MPEKEEQTKKQISVRLDIEDLEKLDVFCEKNDVKRAWVLRTALRRFLEEAEQ